MGSEIYLWPWCKLVNNSNRAVGVQQISASHILMVNIFATGPTEKLPFELSL